jgi:hypothetical protein
MSELQFKDYFKKLQEGKIPPQFLKDKKPEDKDEDSEGKESKDDKEAKESKDDKDAKPKGKFPFAKKGDKTDKKEELKESLSADDMLDALQNASGTDDKFDQALWDWFEENMSDSGIYAGDATPDEYLDAMSDAQIKKCYNEMAKHFKKQLSEAEALDEVYAYTHTWTKEELLEFISELEDDEVQEVGDFIMGELMEEDDFEDDDFESGSYEDEELDEVHYFDKKKSQLDREKKKNVSARKMKARLLKKYYKKNKAKIARKAKIYRKKAKRNPSKVFHHKK